MGSPYKFTKGEPYTEKNNRLLPQIVSDNAKTDPDGIWGEVPVSAADYSQGYRTVTWAALSNAVDGLAWCIDQQLGRSQTFETLAYLGPTDARYPMVLIACIKVGYKALFTSPRNSLEAHANLFDKLQCKTLMVTDPIHPAASSIIQNVKDLKILHIPSLDELLTRKYTSYPYDKQFESARNDPIYCLHTSGSTGLPKPLVYTHEFVTRMANLSQLPPPDGFTSLNDRMAGNRVVCLLPPFHIAGLYISMVMTIFNGNSVIYPISSAPPTGSSLATILSHVSADWTFVAPVQIEDLAKDPKSLDLVTSKLRMIIFSGGSLPKAIGDVVSSKTFLMSYLGSSEFGGFPLLLPEAFDPLRDWSTTQIHPFASAVFEPRDNGFSELVIKKNTKLDAWQTVHVMFPGIEQYNTRDLFAPHATRPDTWVYEGRDDDIIVFLTGEKTCPLTYEATVARCPDVNSALVFGHQRFEAGILIELSPAAHAKAADNMQALVDGIWPSIEQANMSTPAHARIFRSHIIFTTPEKPMLRSAKGTVQRQATLKLYHSQIDNLYSSINEANTSESPNETGSSQQWSTDASSDDGVDCNNISPNSKHASTRDTILDALREVVPSFHVSGQEDWFSKGLDSLQTLRISRLLKQRLNVPTLDPGFIYANPSVDRLISRINNSSLRKAQQVNDGAQSVIPEVRSTFKRYANYLDILHESLESAKPGNSYNAHDPSDGQVVLLTGSTGSIGSYLLKALIDTPEVKHIYCLNRTDDSQTLQVSRNIERDAALPVHFPPERVTFLKARMADVATLGVDAYVYENLLSSVTVVIHNAWPVDFAQTLPSFRSQLLGLSHLALFSARSARNPSLVFLSSISAVMKLKDSTTTVAEAPILTSDPATDGYGQSKLIAERLLQHATKRMNVRTAVVRVGQVAGARHSHGGWNASEWIPRIIRSSKQIGAVPDSLGVFGDRVSWIPIDVLADILRDISLSTTAAAADASESAPASHKVYHAVNPSETSWADLRNVVARGISGPGAPVPLVSSGEWMARLRESAAVSGAESSQASALDGDGVKEVITRNPALLLQDFLGDTFRDRNPLIMDTKQSVKVSRSLESLTPITNEEMLRWTQMLVRS